MCEKYDFRVCYIQCWIYHLILFEESIKNNAGNWEWILHREQKASQTVPVRERVMIAPVKILLKLHIDKWAKRIYSFYIKYLWGSIYRNVDTFKVISGSGLLTGIIQKISMSANKRRWIGKGRFSRRFARQFKGFPYAAYPGAVWRDSSGRAGVFESIEVTNQPCFIQQPAT